MASHEYILSSLRKEIEEKVNALEFDGNYLLIIPESTQSSNLIQLLNLEELENELYNKYDMLMQLLKKNNEDDKEQELWANFNTLDLENNYEFPTENFENLPNKFKIEALIQLANQQIIDTKQDSWPHLSDVLIQCFQSSNNKIFVSSLKIHYRIISFPSTSCDGFMSLLKGALILCTSNFSEYGMINGCDTFNKRMERIMRVVLNTLSFVLRNAQHIKQKTIDEMIMLFVSLLNQTYKSSESSKLIDLLFLLDEEANWFRLFSFATRTREIFIDFLAQQKLLKMILVHYFHVSKITNVNDENLNNFTHLTNCIVYLLAYSDNLKHFPVQIKLNERVSCTDLLEHMLTLLKDTHVSCNIKVVLKSALCKAFLHNPNLLTYKLLLHLIEPFRFFEKKCPFSILDNNYYIIDIITSVTTQDQNVLFSALNKFHKSRLKMHKVHSGCISYRGHINCPQIIIDFTINLLKKCTTDVDKHLPLKANLLALLNCCKHIFVSNSVSLYYVNIKRFLATLKILYEVHSQHRIPVPLELINLLVFFFENNENTFEIIDNDQILRDILDQIFTRVNPKKLNTLICNVASTACGFDIIRRYHNSVIKSRLEKLWYLNHNQNNMANEGARFKAALEDFLLTVFILNTKTKVIKMLLDYENEGTIVEGGEDKMYTLSDLVENCLNYSNGCLEEYIGLLVMKILITNVDMCLLLENNYKLQEQLSGLQNKTHSEIDVRTSYFCKLCEHLRGDILKCLKFKNFPNERLNESIDRSIRSSSALRRRKRSPNELQKFLSTIKNNPSEQHWLSQARRIFKMVLWEPHKESLVVDLLEMVPKSFVYRKRTLTWPPFDSVYHQLFPEDLIGTTLVVNYGLNMGLLNSSSKNEDHLNMLIKQSRTFLSYYPEQFENYDWFLGIIFLACFGDIAKCRDVLVNFSNMNITAVIWHSFSKEFDFIFHENFYTQLRIIIEENSPVAYVALENLGIPLNLLVQNWLGQCFFNILDFEEICNFIIFSVLFPPEATIFYIQAVLEHIESILCTFSYSKTVDNIVQVTESISNFRLADHIANIEKLLKQYRNIIKL